MKKTEELHFRCDTSALFKELVDYTLANGNSGIFKVPLNVFMNLLAQVAQRATQLHDPIMDKLMFDLTLYEVPKPTDPEYSKIMKRVYAAAANQEAKERSQKQPKP